MLSSQQKPKDLPDWIELDYVDRPSRLARNRSILLRSSWAVGLAVGGLLLALPFTRLAQPREVFAAGPLASAHAMFNHDCEKCHTEPLQTWGRLRHFDDARRSVGDATCVKCHDGPAHHPQVQMHDPSCATCHREHRGHLLLARVNDEYCIACHADLRTKTGTPAFAGHVLQFPDKHPEFSAWRGRPLEDAGTIRFNHEVHLRQGLRGPGGVSTKLDCTGCHQPDSAGRYMLPIRYRQHCASCHPLTVPLTGKWSDEQAGEAAGRFRDLSASHPRAGETAVQVRNDLRGRLLGLAREANVLQTWKLETPPRPVPGSLRGSPVLASELDWVNARLGAAERALFDNSGGCAYCHREATPAGKRPDGLPEYVNPALPERWFPHSRFSHNSHGMLGCVACHAKAPGSKRTSDVLLPTLTTCKECHSAAGGARFDCAECHTYHDHAKGRGLNGAMTIEDVTGRPTRREANHP